MAQIQSRGNGLLDAASLVGQLAPIFAGSGTTSTSQSKNSLDPQTVAALQQLISGSALSKDTAISDSQGAVQNALQQLLQQQLPSVGGNERGSGLYNSTTTSNFIQQIGAKAAAQAAGLQLDQINRVTDQRLNAAATLKDANTTATSTSKTSPALSSTAGLLGIGATLLAPSLIGGLFSLGKKAFESGDNTDAPPSLASNSQPSLDLSSLFSQSSLGFSGLGGGGTSGGTQGSSYSGFSDTFSNLFSDLFSGTQGSAGGSGGGGSGAFSFGSGGSPGLSFNVPF